MDLKESIQDRITGDGLVRLLDTLGFPAKRAGREHVILCPFHDDHKPSMTVCSHKNPSGIICCFACDAKHDIFSFTDAAFNLGGFKATLAFLAGKLGIGKEIKGERAKLAPQEVLRKSTMATQMTSAEVYAVYKSLRDKREEVGRIAGELGVRPEALEMLGGFAVTCGRNKDSGCYEPGRGTRCLDAPMRSPIGEMVSIRFRSMAPREPGERARRWSLDQSAPGDPDTQLKHTISGLLVPQVFCDEPPEPGQFGMVVEGETDMAAGLSMMIDAFGLDWKTWPARWFGLPGVNSCHEMLVPEIIGDRAVTLMDPDRAGRGAVFDHKPMVCELCGRGLSRVAFCKYKDGDVVCGGRAVIDVQGEVTPGLLGKLQAQKIRATAAFPPGGPIDPVTNLPSKVDLRDLYRSGWTWERLYGHILATGTRARRERAA